MYLTVSEFSLCYVVSPFSYSVSNGNRNWANHLVSITVLHLIDYWTPCQPSFYGIFKCVCLAFSFKSVSKSSNYCSLSHLNFLHVIYKLWFIDSKIEPNPFAKVWPNAGLLNKTSNLHFCVCDEKIFELISKYGSLNTVVYLCFLRLPKMISNI